MCDVPASHPSPIIKFSNANINGLIGLRFRKILQSSEVLKFCQRTSKELQKGLISIPIISKAIVYISKFDLFYFVPFYIFRANVTKTLWKVIMNRLWQWEFSVVKVPREAIPRGATVLSSFPFSSLQLSNALPNSGSSQGLHVIEMCLGETKVRPKSLFHIGHQWDVRWGFQSCNEFSKFLTSLVQITGSCYSKPLRSSLCLRAGDLPEWGKVVG